MPIKDLKEFSGIYIKKRSVEFVNRLTLNMKIAGMK
jgi:hypothetical protein